MSLTQYTTTGQYPIGQLGANSMSLNVQLTGGALTATYQIQTADGTVIGSAISLTDGSLHGFQVNGVPTPVDMTQPMYLNITALGTGTTLTATLYADGPGADLTLLEKIAALGATAAAPQFVVDAYQAPATTTWNSSTAANTVLSQNTAGFDGTGVTLIGTGTLTGGTIVFEIFDGASWLPTKINRLNTYQGDASYPMASLSGGLTQAWQADVAPFSQFRVRLSAQITGAGSVLVTMVSSSAPIIGPVTVGIDPTSNLPAGAPTTPYNVAWPGNTTPVQVKASSGNVYSAQVTNNATSARSFKIYDTSSAPTVGTTVPKLSFSIPASSTLDFDFGIFGVHFVNGIYVSATGTTTFADTTSPTANDVVATVNYV